VRKIVTTNGCFDLLHAGHVACLRWAADQGDTLIVLVNDDASVSRLKGATRPILPLEDRMAILDALEMVDVVIPFSQDTPCETLSAIRPAVHVKGGDYHVQDLPETKVVESFGGRVLIAPTFGDVHVTDIILRLRDVV